MFFKSLTPTTLVVFFSTIVNLSLTEKYFGQIFDPYQVKLPDRWE
jgi:hypothetical protein